MTALPPTEGQRVCRFIERNCRLGEGDYYGEPVKLRRWQKKFLYQLYELKPDGSRRYRRALLGVPKNAGKTPIASWVAQYEMFGADRTNPIVAVGAASFEQADLVFGDIKTSIKQSPTLRELAEVFDTEILVKGRPGRAYRVAAARGTNDGARPSCFIADEVHEYNDPAKEGAHLVLSNGTTKRTDSLELNISTAGSDLESLLGRLYLKGKRIEAGEERDDAFLFAWHEAPDTFDLDDPNQLRAAIRAANPAADDYVNVEDVARRYREIPRWEFERYFLNRWTRAAESWLPAGVWEACAGTVQLTKGQPAVVGVDMALRHDSVAVVVVQPKDDGMLHVSSKVWRPDGDRIDVAAVENHLRALHRQYSLSSVAYDPAYFERSAQALQDEGLPMVEFPQSGERMVPACQHLYELVVQGKLMHGDDATLNDHVLAAAARDSERGWRLSKGRTKRPIDAAIALVMAAWEASQPAPTALTPFFFFDG